MIVIQIGNLTQRNVKNINLLVTEIVQVYQPKTTKTDISKWPKSVQPLFSTIYVLYFINIDITLYSTPITIHLQFYNTSLYFLCLNYNFLVAEETVPNINCALTLAASSKNVKCLVLDESPCIYIILYPRARRFMKKKFTDNCKLITNVQHC